MKITFCPFSLAVFVGSACYVTLQLRRRSKADEDEAKNKSSSSSKQSSSSSSCQVVFVLGPPGSGKGTQCELLTQRLLKNNGQKQQWAHLSAGDLLRAERKKGGELGDLINARIAAGQLVPSEVTCQLIENAMRDVQKETQGDITKFLIDGFPRSQGNADAWNATMACHDVKFLLSFECPEEVLIGRLLERAQTSGRNDDTIDVIKKRFETFQTKEAPIVKLYEAAGKVRRIAADKPVEDVYAAVVKHFEGL